MQQKKLIINAIVLLLVVGAVIAGYFFLKPEAETTEIGLTSSNDNRGAISAETSEFLILLESLQSVKLDGQIFQNKIFASELVNFTTEIGRRPQGRSNPFSSLGTNNLADTGAAETEESEVEAMDTEEEAFADDSADLFAE